MMAQLNRVHTLLLLITLACFKGSDAVLKAKGENSPRPIIYSLASSISAGICKAIT